MIVYCSSNLIKKNFFFYFSHLSHCSLLSFSLTGVTSSLISSFFFSHQSHFFSLFFFLRHPRLKTTVVVLVLKFYGFVRTQYIFNGLNLYLGSQLTFIVDFEFPTMGSPLLRDPIACSSFRKLPWVVLFTTDINTLYPLFSLLNC